ncbi:phenylacetate--CoA ligase family protein [Streptomyces caniscabiei]|uniref:AMP-binding protein n=1 Tax=Streptomyces caniscabiei TaxID=2746961 RepID=A0ABU4MTU1_9ACTN|nr:AMP-binding protein [Streptomyces caniscabiei]MBE4734649.1 phenylacetate--CoA ligase family protein [Streptomyces caniscabiei]MBE4755520.1 phenylacetate--CoA ligase family protein [Streptomyces caniscabiei]MBE4772356.1 phenylacetate--CoA ligase family protein [Streptomyces caniscabiei]MBE4783196.1 phenylacetate--CoA ligase family protein [Streptomyces caniscabiei]MBE4792500.1 phenylacetate--CoA ligase family protein [Streptomyces caniscabiei]
MDKLPRIGDWATYDELAARQRAVLPQVLARAAKSPFYQARLGPDGTPDDPAGFHRLPTTTKTDLRDNYPFGMLGVAKSELATYHESSGSTGRPTPSYYTEDDWVDLAERFARKRVGIGASDTLLVRTPYAMLLTGHLAHAAGRSHGATVVPGDNRSLAMPYSRVVRALHDLDVTLTWSMPTECLLWAAAARAAGLRPDEDFPALRALFVGGEPLSPARRARISRVWGVPVVEEYGSTETGSLAGECSEGRLHLWADRVLCEVRDPETGEIGTEGTGQLVVTPLHREAMPLLRYNLEDAVEVSYDPCPCGWVLPTVTVLGRDVYGHRIGDTLVTQHRLEDLVYRLPDTYGVLFWRAQTASGHLRVEVEVEAAHEAAACGELAAAVRRELGVECRVEGVAPGGLVPLDVLTGMPDVVKPRSLFGPDEDWNKAVLYY